MSDVLRGTKEEVIAARKQLWAKGLLRWKLDETQQDIYDKFYQFKGRKFVLNCSRRLGKSYLLCVLALEHALRSPDSQIKYAAPTQRQVKRVIAPLFRQILKDCPEDLKPQWFAQEQIWEFPNGSTIAIAGMDAGRSDSLRGTDAHFACVDEAGFSSSNNVQEMVSEVLLPMCLLTNAKIVIASTPPKTPRSAFEMYYKEAAKDGGAVHKTIFDNPRIPSSIIKEFIKESGGENTTVWKREYLAEFIVDEEIVVVPEFTPELQKEVVVEVERPTHFDAYTSMDVGMTDATGILFFYWDFLKARVVVEDEVLLHGAKEVRTDIIANSVIDKETKCWAGKKPYYRVSDIEPILLNDLETNHQIKFVRADKDSKEAAVNELRLMVKNKQIYINPRCKNLIAQLESCVWNNAHDSFDRIDGYYHFDLVDALIYGIRAIRRQRNPYPDAKYNEDLMYVPDGQRHAPRSPTAKTFVNIFKPKNFK